MLRLTAEERKPFSSSCSKKKMNLSDKADKGSSVINCTHTRSFQFSSVHPVTVVSDFVTAWTAAPPEFPVHHQLPELPQTHIH